MDRGFAKLKRIAYAELWCEHLQLEHLAAYSFTAQLNGDGTPMLCRVCYNCQVVLRKEQVEREIYVHDAKIYGGPPRNEVLCRQTLSHQGLI